MRRKEDDAREKRKEKQFLEALLTIQNSMFNFLFTVLYVCINLFNLDIKNEIIKCRANSKFEITKFK